MTQEHTLRGRADSRFVPSQWEMALLCNNVSHWLGTSLQSALWGTDSRGQPLQAASFLLTTGLCLGLRPANERRRYFVTTSLIGWAQTSNQPCNYNSDVTWPTWYLKSRTDGLITLLLSQANNNKKYQTNTSDLQFPCTCIVLEPFGTPPFVRGIYRPPMDPPHKGPVYKYGTRTWSSLCRQCWLTWKLAMFLSQFLWLPMVLLKYEYM